MGYPVVTCKNSTFHQNENPFHGYRIGLTGEQAKKIEIDAIVVTCPQCGRTSSYSREDLLTSYNVQKRR